MALTVLEYSDRRTKMGTLVLDVLTSEEIEFPAEVTLYPTEDGAQISDHITQGPERVRISGLVSTADVVAFAYFRDGGGQGATKLVEATDLLREMHQARALVSISTGQLLHSDMGIAGMTARRSAGGDGGNWLEIQAEFVKIRRVRLKQAEAPAAGSAGDGGAKGRTGKTAAKAGKATAGTGGASGKEQFGPPEATPDGSVARGAGRKVLDAFKGFSL